MKTNSREWHPWFAWYPVWIDGERIWLRWVERRAAYYRIYDNLRFPQPRTDKKP